RGAAGRFHWRSFERLPVACPCTGGLFVRLGAIMPHGHGCGKHAARRRARSFRMAQVYFRKAERWTRFATRSTHPESLTRNAANEIRRFLSARHARPWAGHPRLCSKYPRKTWMAGTSPAMTKNDRGKIGSGTSDRKRHQNHRFASAHNFPKSAKRCRGDVARTSESGHQERQQLAIKLMRALEIRRCQDDMRHAVDFQRVPLRVLSCN